MPKGDLFSGSSEINDWAFTRDSCYWVKNSDVFSSKQRHESKTYLLEEVPFGKEKGDIVMVIINYVALDLSC